MLSADVSRRIFNYKRSVIVHHSWEQAQRDKNIWQELGRRSFLHGAEWNFTEQGKMLYEIFSRILILVVK